MAQTYETIATSTLTGTASEVNFSNISGSWSDILLSAQCSASAGVPQFHIQFNGDTGTNYGYQYMFGTGGNTIGYARGTSQAYIDNGSIGGATNRSTVFLHISNNTSTPMFKQVLSRNIAAPDNTGWIGVGVWKSTAVITSIRLFTASSTFTADSVFTLYGIKGA